MREVVGERELQLPDEVATAEDARNWLARDYPELLDPRIRIALDDRLAIGDEAIGDAREIAFLPPVSGG